MQNTPTVLPLNEMKIIKRINIISRSRNDLDLVIGYILYEREFASGYKVAMKQENNNLFLTPYPKQEDFPRDDIDNLILETVRKNYPSSQLDNSLLFTTSDVEQIQNLKERPFKNSNLIITPDFTVQSLNKLVGQSSVIFRKSIKIYANAPLEYIKQIAFYGTCDFQNHQLIFDSLGKINFL